MGDRWTVYVEIDGRAVWQATYSDISAAQMALAGKELDYHYRARLIGGPVVAIGITQS